MKNLLPFIGSLLIPGLGQLALKKHSKGILMIGLWLLLPTLILQIGFLNWLPWQTPHLLLVIWATSDLYDTLEKAEGKASTIRSLAFSVLLVLIIFPALCVLLVAGLFKGGDFIVHEYLNEDRTKTEMNEIKLQLEKYKNYYGYYPTDYGSYISSKPIWSSWLADSWQTPYKYQLIDSTSYKLISAGKDEIFNTQDDIISDN